MAKKAQPKNYAGRRKGIPDFTVSEWEGLNTFIKDITELPKGASPNSLNWITGKYKDHIELRRGYSLLGTSRVAGNGRITGLGVARTAAAVEVPFFTYAQKINYYNATTLDVAEIGTNSLPSQANGEDVSIMPYQNLAGAWAYITSPNSSIYKIAASNPADLTDLQSRAFRGKAKIDTNRMFMWDRRDTVFSKYINELYIGVSDASSISSYTQTTKENAGAAAGLNYSGTLAYRASSPKKTCFFTEFGAPIDSGFTITGITAVSQAVVTAAGNTYNVGDVVFIDSVSGMTEINNLYGVVMAKSGNDLTISINSSTFTGYSSGGTIYKAEYFYDDKNGNLVSNAGGTGTINYTTGAFTLVFITAPLAGKAVYAQYYTEDATSGGIADFTIDGSTIGKGKIFPQYDGGGALQAVFPFDQVQYCFHINKTWYVALGNDDTKASNLPYRSTFGIPYFRGGFPTPDGILVLDNGVPSNPKVKMLEIDASVSANLLTVVPKPISDMLDLTGFGFSQCVMRRWGDYDILACANVTNGVVDTVNTVFFIRNIFSQQWDRLDYAVSCLEEYYGTLISGDSLSNNLYTLFSGFDDDGALINNYWQSKQFDLSVEGVKRIHRFVIRGLIQNTQVLDLYLALDSGSFTKFFSVQGNASYVNTGIPVLVGSNTVGSQVVGGGSGVGAPVTAYPFEVEIEFTTDLFEYIQAQFIASSIGFVQIDTFTFKDIRWKGKRLPAIRQSANT